MAREPLPTPGLEALHDRIGRDVALMQARLASHLRQLGEARAAWQGLTDRLLAGRPVPGGLAAGAALLLAAGGLAAGLAARLRRRAGRGGAPPGSL